MLLDLLVVFQSIEEVSVRGNPFMMTTMKSRLLTPPQTDPLPFVDVRIPSA